jgi:N-acetylneuraminic acid mutarotase
MGGVDASGRLDQIVEYDTAADSIAVKSATLPTKRREIAVAASPATGRIYCFGGADVDCLRQIVEYDPANDSIVTKVAILPTKTSGAAAVADQLSGKIYCLGGGDCNVALSQIVEYDPTTDSVVIKSATLPTGRYGLAAAADPLTGKIYCFGGRHVAGPPYLNEIVEYDIASDRIETRNARLPTGRSYLAATSSNTGKIYCFGGDNGSSILNEIAEYTPPSHQGLLQVGDPGDGFGAVASFWDVFSSRALKSDIDPLQTADYRTILDKVNATDVVRYRYTHDARQTRHLGVIAEDAPREILSPGGQAVSLADYNAFLLAAIKAQQAELAEMRARLEALEALMAQPAASAEGR